MDIGSVFLILALLLLVGLFVSRPLFERKAVAVSREEHEHSHLMAERDRILNALQELDFDHELGKIPESDYPAQRAALLQRGADILRQLDQYGHEASSERWEEQIESAIATRRRHAGQPDKLHSTPTQADDDLESLIAARRRSRQEKTAGFCSQCGRAVQVSDKFCPNCGSGLG